MLAVLNFFVAAFLGNAGEPWWTILPISLLPAATMAFFSDSVGAFAITYVLALLFGVCGFAVGRYVMRADAASRPAAAEDEGAGAASPA
jgi:hypothetical protein